MGSIYAEHVLKVARPRIGLLNIGEEDEKGDALAREAHALMRGLRTSTSWATSRATSMIGHVADVVVCDGFVGNVVIKFFEGLTSYIFRSLRTDLQQGPMAPLALLALKPGFDRLKHRFDYERYGGAPLLGVRGVSIVTHGRAKARMIEHAMRVASEAAEARHPGPDRRVDAVRHPALAAEPPREAPDAIAPIRSGRPPDREPRPDCPGRAAPHRPPARGLAGAAAGAAGAVRGGVPAVDRRSAALERLAAEQSAYPGGRGARARGSCSAWPSTGRSWTSEIARLAPAIPVSELGRVERTILRSAIYEVLYSAATPSGETIHDAVSLARTYAGDAARRLVNGVLGSVVADHRGAR